LVVAGRLGTKGTNEQDVVAGIVVDPDKLELSLGVSESGSIGNGTSLSPVREESTSRIDGEVSVDEVRILCVALLVWKVDCHVVGEVGSNVRVVDLDWDSEGAEEGRGANSRALQNLGGEQVRGEDDFLSGVGSVSDSIVLEDDSLGYASLIDDDCLYSGFIEDSKTTVTHAGSVRPNDAAGEEGSDGGFSETIGCLEELVAREWTKGVDWVGEVIVIVGDGNSRGLSCPVSQSVSDGSVSTADAVGWLSDIEETVNTSGRGDGTFSNGIVLKLLEGSLNRGRRPLGAEPRLEGLTELRG